MRLILALYFVTLTAASTVHFGIPTLKATPAVALRAPEDKAEEYRAENSKGYYSYGYLGETAAKAEYKTLDGSSKGFYSYVDADGKLQTVKYEAGEAQGFQVTATNLPKAPVDNRKAPLPVKDTPEVQMAKEAHFEAYREAERLAALSPDTAPIENLSQGEMQSAILQNSKEQLLAMMMQSGGVDTDADIDIDGNDNDGDGNVDGAAEQNLAQTNEQYDDAREHMTSYTLSAGPSSDASGLSHLRAILDNSNFVNGRSLHRLQNQLHGALQHSDSMTNLQDEVRVPVHSYVSVMSPSTNYKIISPTLLATLPHVESLRRGHNLPISLSTSFLSQRIKSP